MFRKIYEIRYVVDIKAIFNLRRYSVTLASESYVNIPINSDITKSQRQSINKDNPIIVCKRKQFNFYPGTTYNKFETIPIASQGWHHSLSKGDYFTINPIIEDEDEPDENCRFEDFNLDSRLIENLKKMNIKEPTTIQSRAIPKIFNGENMIITAETGCGKTLTYLLPIITQILKWKPMIESRPLNSPFAVIITPSRELALQIGEHANMLSKGLDIDVKVLTGGRTKKLMRNPSIKNIDILVGTLGVTCKLTAVQMYKLNNIRYTVFDEAHALFDETFNEKMIVFLRRINFGFKQTLAKIPQSSQLLLVSATMPEELPEYLSQSVDPKSLINVATRNCHRVLVPQKFLRLGEIQKPPTLLKILRWRVAQKLSTIVFSNSSRTSDWISIFLNHMNIKTISLNGGMRMVIRKDKYRIFRNAEVYVLSTTNTGARGLNTTMVDCVINYDFPLSTADYVHRCGRTGRIGSAINGQVFNFVTKPIEIELVQKIERATRRNRSLPMFHILDVKEKSINQELKSLMSTGKIS